jgi:tetratricopeptide (TPR) repeat protein
VERSSDDLDDALVAYRHMLASNLRHQAHVDATNTESYRALRTAISNAQRLPAIYWLTHARLAGAYAECIKAEGPKPAYINGVVEHGKRAISLLSGENTQDPQLLYCAQGAVRCLIACHELTKAQDLVATLQYLYRAQPQSAGNSVADMLSSEILNASGHRTEALNELEKALDNFSSKAHSASLPWMVFAEFAFESLSGYGDNPKIVSERKKLVSTWTKMAQEHPEKDSDYNLLDLSKAQNAIGDHRAATTSMSKARTVNAGYFIEKNSDKIHQTRDLFIRTKGTDNELPAATGK